MQRTRVNKKIGDQLDAPGECVGYGVYDPLGQRIGTAEKIFVNKPGEPQYIRVKMGVFGWKSILIPVESVAVNPGRKAITLE